MSARMIIDFSEGQIVLFGGAPEEGVADGGLMNGATRAAASVLEGAFGALGEIAATLERAVGALPNRPETVEVEFGATLSSEGDLWVVGEDASPEFRIRLSWSRP
ncbi:CU044_2847 family protein [Methylocella sp.]|uniref:CU044_2847 family protein n=1 Tax=Methylocella sp. TaxID=1978226 RepID=UPI003783AB82